MSYLKEISKIFQDVRARTKPRTPVEWAEAKRSLSSAVSALPGKIDYNNSPYLREIVNNFDPRSPVREMAILKGAQVGITQLVLETIMGYTIDVCPRSILFLSADKELAEANMETRIDSMLASTGLEDKLKPSSGKKKNRSTGDTKGKKEFAGGILYAYGGNSPTKLRSISVPVLLFDEFDGVKNNVGGDGNPGKLAESRTFAFENVRKISYTSTPSTEATSNILPLYLKGDQRKWFVPCPHCGEFQQILWNGKENFNDEVTNIKESVKSTAGIKYSVDSRGVLIPNSVYYECKNGCKIKEEDKYIMNLKGEWRATAKSKKRDFVSYHLTSLISNFSSWETIVNEFLEAKIDKDVMQVWVNNRLGEAWKEQPKVIDVTKLNKNVARYVAGIVPNKIALEHGNSKIAMLICAVDVNGSTSKSSGWLAVEIKGFCENGASYSIAKAELHGSLESNGGCWNALHLINQQTYFSDDGLEYKITTCFIDSGARTNTVYEFTKRSNRYFAVKGVNKNSTYRFRKQQQEKANAYNINVNKYKDDISEYLEQSYAIIQSQPNFFLNFPVDNDKTGFEDMKLEKLGVTVAGGGYNQRYYSTFASEEKKQEKNKLTGEIMQVGVWEKLHSRSYTHFWDCNVYLFAGLDITCDILGKAYDVAGANTMSMLAHFSNFIEENGVPFYD